MRKICMYAIIVVSLRRNLISKQQRLMKRSILFTIALLMIAVMVSAKQYQVTASKLNVRNAPDTSGKVVGSLSQNATVEVNRISGGWAEITFKGQKAYISAQYITPVKAAAKSNNTQNTNKNTAAKNNSKGSKDTKNKSYVDGFHISLGAFWTGRNYVDETGIWPMGRDGNNRYGLSTGLGLEYSGAVYRGSKLNVLLGFRSGLYYDWHGTLTWPDDGADPVHTQSYRVSVHSFTIPLQPMLSLEWKAGKVGMALGWFTGPVFELYLAHNDISWGTWDGQTYIMIDDYISGREWFMKGSFEPEEIEYPDRSGVFNCYWGTGMYFQVDRFRVQFSTDWGIHKYSWTNGGTRLDGSEADAQRCFINRFITLGFSVTLY